MLIGIAIYISRCLFRSFFFVDNPRPIWYKSPMDGKRKVAYWFLEVSNLSTEERRDSYGKDEA